MRENKYRAWNGKKYLGEFTIEDAIAWGCICGHGKSHEFYGADILEQFTGLRDKNGKEIYEGDIVHYWQSIDGRDGTGFHRNLVVDGHETGPLFRVIGLGEYEGPYTTYKMDEMLNPRPFDNVRGNLKIIGNIHENPELMEKSEPK